MKKFEHARDALRYLIRAYNIKSIYLPYYLCDVMRHTVVEEKCKPIFYHIDDNFMPVQEFPKSAYIVYPNYFGICDKNVDNLIELYPKLIVDNAHAYYAVPRGFASFNSAKKFLPVSDGAYLWIGNNEGLTLSDNKRYEQFMYYHKKLLDNQLKIDIQQNTVPFCYPYLAPTIELADKLVEKLTKDGKTIYRYWNNLPKTYNEYKFYSRLVPIPLDE